MKSQAFSPGSGPCIFGKKKTRERWVQRGGVAASPLQDKLSLGKKCELFGVKVPATDGEAARSWLLQQLPSTRSRSSRL